MWMLKPWRSTTRTGLVPLKQLMSGSTDVLESTPRSPWPMLSATMRLLREGTFLPVENVTVWEKISTLTRSHECWTYIRPAQRTHNGCLAYRAIKNHYLGPNNMNHQANEVEAKPKDSS